MRVVLALLIGLPLLMPPGVCLCQFVPCHAAPTPAAPACDASAEDPPRPGSRCRCRAVHPSEQAPPQDQPTPATPRPTPPDHQPDCPGFAVPTLAQPPVPADPAPLLLDLSWESAVLFVAWVPVARAPLPSADQHPTPPRLALFCTLLI